MEDKIGGACSEQKNEYLSILNNKKRSSKKKNADKKIYNLSTLISILCLLKKNIGLGFIFVFWQWTSEEGDFRIEKISLITKDV